MKGFEERFEELENIINNEVVRDIVTDLKNDTIEILDALIKCTKRYCYNCPDPDTCSSQKCGNYKYINLIEKATGRKWAEIIEEK